MRTSDKLWTSLRGSFYFIAKLDPSTDPSTGNMRPSLFNDPATRGLLESIGAQLRARGYRTGEPKQGKGCFFLAVKLSGFELSTLLRRVDLQPVHPKFHLWTLPRKRGLGKQSLNPSDIEDWRLLCDALEEVLTRVLGVEGLQRFSEAEAASLARTRVGQKS